MEAKSQHLINTRINTYLTKKVQETFPEDFHLIENGLTAHIARYTLKELILITRIEIDRIKRKNFVSYDNASVMP